MKRSKREQLPATIDPPSSIITLAQQIQRTLDTLQSPLPTNMKRLSLEALLQKINLFSSPSEIDTITTDYQNLYHQLLRNLPQIEQNTKQKIMNRITGINTDDFDNTLNQAAFVLAEQKVNKIQEAINEIKQTTSSIAAGYSYDEESLEKALIVIYDSLLTKRLS